MGTATFSRSACQFLTAAGQQQQPQPRQAVPPHALLHLLLRAPEFLWPHYLDLVAAGTACLLPIDTCKETKQEADGHSRIQHGQLLRSLQQHPWLLTFRDAGGVVGSIGAQASAWHSCSGACCSCFLTLSLPDMPHHQSAFVICPAQFFTGNPAWLVVNIAVMRRGGQLTSICACCPGAEQAFLVWSARQRGPVSGLIGLAAGPQKRLGVELATTEHWPIM